MITICDPSFYRKLENKNFVKLIAVVDKDFGIAKNGKILWSFNDDIRFFSKVTNGFPIIMGRKTFFSIPNAPLKNRINCVISRTLSTINKSSILIFDSLEKAIKKYPNAWIIGGAEIFNYAIVQDLIDFALITCINKRYNADIFIDSASIERLNNIKKFEKKILWEAENNREEIYNITSYLRV